MGDIMSYSELPPVHTFARPNLNPRDPENAFRNILDLVEYNAVHNPDHLFAVQLQKDPHVEMINITHRDLKHLVIACANYLQEDVLESTNSGPVALLLESDINLILYVFALMRLGIPVLLLSARLSPAAIHHLIVTTGAFSVIASAGLKTRVEDSLTIPGLTQEVQLRDQMPFDQFVAQRKGSAKAEPVTLADRVAETRKACLIFHSSGTTGMPKPIFHTERYFLAFATCHNIPDDPLGPCFSTLPLYHAFGWVPPCLSLGIGMPVCFPPTSTIPNVKTMAYHLKLIRAWSLCSVPSILEDFATSPDLAEAVLGRLAFVAFGGGKLRDSAGQTLAARSVKLLNHFGATESGPLAPLFAPDESYDWHYFRLRLDMESDLCSTGFDSEGREQFQLTIRPLGWEIDFQLQDHLVRKPGSLHPDYNAVGRKDDVLVLANGEKVQPGILEAQVIEECSVQAVVAFGNDRAEIGVLVQPSQPVGTEELDVFIDSVWLAIEKANLLMDAHAQINSKHCILVVPYDKTLPRSDKGSIMRKEVYAMFAEEIKHLYDSLDSLLSQEAAEPMRVGRLEEDVSNLIHKHIQLRMQREGTYDDEDLFELGLDSLQAVQLRRRLQASLQRSSECDLRDKRLPRDFVYLNPSVRKIAQSLRGDSVENSTFESLVDRFQMDSTIPDLYGHSHAAVVTGATGSLGSHIVADLIQKAAVSRIVCLVRPLAGRDAKQRVLDALSRTMIKTSPAELSKIHVLECHTSRPRLGLTMEVYESLLKSTRWIVHAAWPMDFKLKLASFEGAFRTLQNLLLLTKALHHTQWLCERPKFVFISSIAAVGKWSDTTGETVIPEKAAIGPEYAVNIGYAQAKLVCEAIVDRASGESGICAQYIRVGQLTGSSQTGSWNTDEHLPAMLKSSQVIGVLPRLTGTLSWIPVDIAGQVVSDIVLSETEEQQTVFHVENPVRQSWADMLASISHHLRASPDAAPLQVVAYQEWLRRLAQQEDMDVCPAAKLLPFFADHFEHMACGGVTLDTFAARRASVTLRHLRRLGQAEVVKYVDRWREMGFLA